jgi:hypothetical protein
MTTRQGTLHIVRNFYTTENQGVYDVTFTSDRPEPQEKLVVRRFEDDQALADFLLKRLQRDPNEIRNIMARLSESNHATIPSLHLDEDKLRDLKLAA